TAMPRSGGAYYYVNQGLGADSVPTFEEKAQKYGIADSGYTTHAAFFDYDQDGDLDLYVLNAAMEEQRYTRLLPKRTEGEAANTDHLYRNEGDGSFTDVSAEAGIQIEGYGLGVGITDINKDGWPDIYVANDFASNDLFYVNNGDGTFTNRIDRYLKHQSYSAMGADLADVNNDARTDIMVLDMLPWRNPRLRLVPTSPQYSSPARARRFGYAPQYDRNTLQLNNGVSPAGHLTFSEIAQLAGVDATGWSWAPLLADFDNDGDRDLFVSNGYGKDVTNLDILSGRQKMVPYGGDRKTREKAFLEATEDLPSIHLPNRFFENDGHPGRGSEQSLHFTDRTGAWATRRSGISNGAAFADLDRDGDLDLVTNNLNEEATVLENQASKRDSSHALQVRLYGPDGNRAGFGTRLTLYDDGTTQYHHHSTYRGYQSTVGQRIHFGLGADSTADSLEVIWPDDSRQLLTDIDAGQVLPLHYEDASPPPGEESSQNSGPAHTSSPLFDAVAAERGLDYAHTERPSQRRSQNPLLPHVFTKNEPGVAVGDVNGDGRDDVFVGADRGDAPALLLQAAPGQFTRRSLSMDPSFEDMGALFFDADGDGDQDLYVVSGGDAGPASSSAYQDRLYLNDGQGRFRRAPSGALPEMSASGSVVTAADYDRDGDLDLFVGGRVRPGDYPMPPRSYLLRNDSDKNQVQFVDVTTDVAPDLANVGLVSDALWTDYNNDGQVDLLLAGEWMPITLFRHSDTRFTEVTSAVGLEGTTGWWNSLAAGDFDRDGDMDYVAGNLGLNTKYETASSTPVRVYAKDIDKNGDLDPILTRYVDGTEVPAHSRGEFVEQIPEMKSRFPTYREYGKATIDEVLPPSEQKEAYVREAVRFETSYLENTDGHTFEVRSLPMRTQTAPVFGIMSGDYDGDGALDLLMVGNWYAPEEENGRADAFIGAYLRGDGTGHFRYESYSTSGFFVDGDAKGLAEVGTGEGNALVLAAQNDGPFRAFSTRGRTARAVSLHARDRYAHLSYGDGETRKVEFYRGSSYLSQSSRVLYVPPEVEKTVIHEADGNQRTVRP
ncbi:MAG: VCBS repeat-containing protein, partial [Salinibacter sp.]